MEKQSEFSYFAFISYNSADEKWAKWLQHNLEYFHIPSGLCKEYPELPKKIRPVFWYKKDLSGTNLKRALNNELSSSKYLIVVCSPDSAKSLWVNDEVEAFIESGKGDRIIPFIVAGTPHAKNPDEECFPPVLRDLTRDEEIRGIDVRRKEGKYHALVDVIATMFGVRFDVLWKRHRRRKIRNICLSAVGAILVIAALIGVWIANQPINVDVQLTEKSFHNDNLPPLKDAIVTLRLDDEIKRDTISDLDDIASFVNIPHYNLGKDVGMSIVCRDWLPIDTIVVLDRQMNIEMNRDVHVYGDIDFGIWNSSAERMLPKFSVTVDKYDAVSDEKGRVRLFIPLEEQRTAYKVNTSVPLVYDSIHLPHGENDVVIIK